MADDTILNAHAHGDLGATSFLPVAVRLSGNDVWRAAHPALPEPRRPVHLALAGDVVLVSYIDAVAAFRRDTGDLLWSREVRSAEPFTVAAPGLLTFDFNFMAQWIDVAGHAAEPIHLSGVDSESIVHLAVPDDGDWLLCCEEIPSPVSSPEEDDLPPIATLQRYQPALLNTVWEYELPPELVGVRAVPDLTLFYVATHDRLLVMPASPAAGAAPSAVPLPTIRSLSVDPQGRALVARTSDKDGLVTCVAADGTTAWEVSLDRARPGRQPVASTPEGLHYLVAGRSLHQIAGGALQWSRPLAADPDGVRFTVLADGSVLVFVGQALHRFDRDGGAGEPVFLAAEPTTRPVAAADGRIYYGSAAGIHCLE